MQKIRSHFETIQNQIATACAEANRDIDEVQLIAVSKNFDSEAVKPVLELGHRHFGENRVQEAAGKWPELRETYEDVHLALIGPLQSNKAGQAVALFDGIYSIDREKIARAIAKEMQKQNKSLDLMVQVNIGNEPQKAGLSEAQTERFLQFCAGDLGLKITGLMCIPPADQPPDHYFFRMKQIQEQFGLPFLSMGMSADYAKAIEMGSTHIRVGSALFGKRT